MANPEMQLEEVKEIVADVENGRPHTNALLALMTLSEAGFVFVGTSDPTPTERHLPQPAPRIRSLLHGGIELYLDEPNIPLLQVTWSGKLAILHARCGDVNVPGQREMLGKSYGSFGTHYGWRGMVPDRIDMEGGSDGLCLDENDILPHADRRLATKLYQSPREPDYVDIIRPDPEATYEWCFTELQDAEPVIRNGIFLTREPQDVVARMTILGRDIRLIGLEAREPEIYERSVL